MSEPRSARPSGKFQPVYVTEESEYQEMDVLTTRHAGPPGAVAGRAVDRQVVADDHPAFSTSNDVTESTPSWTAVIVHVEDVS